MNASGDEVGKPIGARLDPLKPAYDAIRSMLHGFEKDEPLPPDFWEDPFVLGFIASCIEETATRAGAERDDFKDVPKIYLALLEGDGPDVFLRSKKLHMEGNADFQRGVEVSNKFLAVANGSLVHVNDLAIIHALASESVERMQREWEEMADCLLEGLFFQEVRKRLGGHRKLN